MAINRKQLPVHLLTDEAKAAVAISAAEAPLPQSHKWLIAIAVMLGTVLEMLDSSIVNVALPHMQGSFSAGLDEVTWVVTSYLVANGIMIPMTGWISARFGRKRYFLFSVVGFVLASAACGAARTLDQMVFFRLLQGFAGAAMQPSSQAILMETFEPEEQAMAMAIYGLGMMVAPVMGPTLGGWITDNWSWRWNFYINVPIGIAAFIMVSAFLQDPPYMRNSTGRRGNVDYPAIVLLVVGLGLLQLVLDRGQRADWFASSWVTFSTITAVACLVGLVYRELTFSDPILDLRIFKIPTFSLATTLIMVMFFTMFGINIMNSLFLQEFMSYTAFQAGLALGPRGVGSALAMLAIGQLARRNINVRPLMYMGLVLEIVGVWQMMHWNLQITFWDVMWPTLMLSTGFSFIFPVLTASSVACVARERMGYAASLFSLVRNTGAAVGISVLTTILVNHQQIHQSYLVEHFSVFDAWRMAAPHHHLPGAPQFLRLPMQSLANKKGLASIYGQIQLQASMMALNDIYAKLIWVVVVVTPVLLTLWIWQSRKTARPTSKEAAALVH